MPTIQATKIRNEGNVVYINADPAIGVLALTSFTDDATGESGGTYFKRSFRYSKNGVTWTDWEDLTPTAITSISVATADTLCIELAFEKIQPVGTDVLNVSSAEIGDTETTFTEGDYFKGSIFYEFFRSTDVNVLRWYISVLEKLYERGIIPPFIERKNEIGLPDDFVDFWKSICKFFSYLVVYARSYQKFPENLTLIAEYVRERGLAVSVDNSVGDVNHLMETFSSQIFNRGTKKIINTPEKGVDGELLRLIYYKENFDEFLFNLFKPEHFGWNIGNCSPLHKGLYLNDNINKSYETGTQVLDLDKYPTIGDVSIEIDGDNSTMLMDATVDTAGIESHDVSAYGIKVDPSIDYEVSFLIKKSRGQTLNFGVLPFDSDDNVLSFLSASDGSSTNRFLNDATLVRDDKYILVRGFLYNNVYPVYPGTMDLNQGNNLIFPKETVRIIPIITVDDGTANVYAIRIMPMQTAYSRGFIQVKNFISCWLKNNNAHLSMKQVKDYIVKYLIPYNSYIQPTLIGKSPYIPDFPVTTTTTTVAS